MRNFSLMRNFFKAPANTIPLGSKVVWIRPRTLQKGLQNDVLCRDGRAKLRKLLRCGWWHIDSPVLGGTSRMADAGDGSTVLGGGLRA
jgi:hypothetical protein